MDAPPASIFADKGQISRGFLRGQRGRVGTPAMEIAYRFGRALQRPDHAHPRQLSSDLKLPIPLKSFRAIPGNRVSSGAQSAKAGKRPQPPRQIGEHGRPFRPARCGQSEAAAGPPVPEAATQA
jgi:hypothetical protein